MNASPAAASSRRSLIAAALAAAVLAGGALRVAAFAHHQRVDFDEGRYLDNASHLLRGHGFATSTVSCFFGDPPRPPRPEDVSSPLYPALLAALFTATGPSFAAAKTLSLILAVGCIPLAYLLGRRLFGEGPGLASAAAFALHPQQATTGVLAMTESLYTFLMLLTLLAAAPLALGGPRPARARLAIGLGLLAGALYLVRQNGAAPAATAAILTAFGPLAAGERRPRRLALAALLAACAAAACLPWFVRNVRTFGSPTFSRMKNIAWAEEGRSLYTPGEPEPSLRRYLEERGPRALAYNLRVRAWRSIRETLAGEKAPFLWLSILAFTAPLSASCRRGSAAALLPAILSAALFVGVAPWSGALSRYLLPLRPLLYAAGAAAAIAWGRAAAEAARLPVRAVRAAAVLVAAGGLVWAAAASLPEWRDHMARDEARASALALEAASWIASNTAAGEVLLEGGYLHQYAYLFERGVVWVPYGDIEAVFAIAERYGASYLAVTPEVVRFRPVLGRHWGLEGRAVRPLAVPPRLEPVLDRGGGGLILYRVLRRDQVRELE